MKLLKEITPVWINPSSTNSTRSLRIILDVSSILQDLTRLDLMVVVVLSLRNLQGGQTYEYEYTKQFHHVTSSEISWIVPVVTPSTPVDLQCQATGYFLTQQRR